MKRYFLAFFCLFSLYFCTNIHAQDNWWKDKKYRSESKKQKFLNCKKVFVDIAEGLTYSNLYIITGYFGPEVYISFSNGEKGYYSKDQAQYILDSFFNNYPVYSFKWKLSNRSENYAFALGKYKYKSNGYVNNYDISASLKYINGQWLIDQIIVN